ncbi:hypothetical protein AAVH_08191 [Aphelenchoides avenae]|nr:hypothetical protein AAVH_08191 [Aphelenchus avenae]
MHLWTGLAVVILIIVETFPASGQKTRQCGAGEIMGQKDATCRKPFPPMTYGYAKCVCAAGRHRVKGRCRTCPHKKRKVTAKKQPRKTTTKKTNPPPGR